MSAVSRIKLKYTGNAQQNAPLLRYNEFREDQEGDCQICRWDEYFEGKQKHGWLKIVPLFYSVDTFLVKKKLYIYFIYVYKLQRFWKYIDI